jgi:L-ascorbate metabolism protein UlaG (beta-lactamase superfamily)
LTNLSAKNILDLQTGKPGNQTLAPMIPKIFGTTPSGQRLAKIISSPQYTNGAFQNPEPTEITLKDASMVKMMRAFLNKPQNTIPSIPPPTVHTNIRSLTAGDKPQFVWFGHSSYYILSREAAILVDPVFSGHASPVSFFANAFPGTNIYGAADFDHIDILVLTHDHYDHLDYETIRALAPRVDKFVTALGVGAHLEYWGIDPEKIIELDLWESAEPVSGVSFTAAPGRHFSGRLFRRNQTLWCSFVLQLGGHRLFLGGDSGYGAHFAEIGRRFGPFDLAFLESGQYGDNWPYIHMLPEQTVQAAREINTGVLLPVHWGKFCLSLHPWNEPIKRVVRAAAQARQPIVTPKIGEVLTLAEGYPQNEWW